MNPFWSIVTVRLPAHGDALACFSVHESARIEGIDVEPEENVLIVSCTIGNEIQTVDGSSVPASGINRTRLDMRPLQPMMRVEVRLRSTAPVDRDVLVRLLDGKGVVERELTRARVRKETQR